MTDVDDLVATAAVSSGTPSMTGLETLQSWASGRGDPPPHMADLGLTVASASFGSVTLHWRPAAALMQEDGTVRDGFVPLVCSEAASLAAASLGLRFRPMRALDLHATCLRPAIPRAVCRAHAEVAYSGTARIVTETQIEDPENRPLARATGSFAPVPIEAPQPAPTGVTVPEPRDDEPFEAGTPSEPPERGLWVPAVPTVKDLVPHASRVTADNLRPADGPSLSWGQPSAETPSDDGWETSSEETSARDDWRRPPASW